MPERINVTQSILPERTLFHGLVDEILDSRHLTNNGPKCVELERRLAAFLDVGANNLTLCGNGTLGLEIAIHAAGAAGKRVITTPFTYVATITAPLWVGCRVDFADIEQETLCIDPNSVASALREDTAAVIPVNIYGHPCDDDALRALCGNIPLVYDAAQAFGATLDGRSLLDFGDLAICSLHATKVLHSFEGGFVVSHTPMAKTKLCLLRAFGHDNDDYLSLGINAKMTEIHAAMGLSLLSGFERHLEKRKRLDAIYRALLDQRHMRFPDTPDRFHSNYGYFPVIFHSEKMTLKVVASLRSRNIYPRRYFFPALTKVGYLNPDDQSCPVAEDIAPRVLCLPLFSDLPEGKVELISEIVNQTVRS